MPSFDVIIIGAGFAGGATAYHLSKIFSGRILLLEKENEIGVHASGRNAGLLRQAVERADTAALIAETRDALFSPPDDWETRGLFQAQGSLLLGDFDTLQTLRSNMKNAEKEADLLAFEALLKKFPASISKTLSRMEAPYALHTKRDGVLDPKLLLENFIKPALRRGVVLKLNSEVRELKKSGDIWELKTDEGKFSSPILVNASGAWAAPLAAGIAFPREELTPFRRHLYLSEGREEIDPSWPFLWDINKEFYFRPHQEGLLWSAGDEDPQTPKNPEVDPSVKKILLEKAAAIFQSLPILRVKKSWACLRTKSRSGRFLIDWDEEAQGFLWVAALGGHGLSASFGVGRCAAEKIASVLEKK